MLLKQEHYVWSKMSTGKGNIGTQDEGDEEERLYHTEPGKLWSQHWISSKTKEKVRERF